MLIALLLGTFLLGLSLVLVCRSLLFTRFAGNAALARVHAYTGEASAQAALAVEAKPKTIQMIAGRLGNHLMGRFRAFDEREIREALVAAGIYSLWPHRFLGYRVMLTVGLPVFWLLLASSGGQSALMTFGGAVLGAVLGWRLPMAYLQKKARLRLERIDRVLPSLVDLLVVTIEAGVSFAGSLQIAADHMRGPLRDELRLTLNEQQMGLSTTESLRNLQLRCKTASMSSFVRALAQGETLGVSIGKIMRDLAIEMRSRQRASAEERAQKAPVKLLFPLVFMIFPAMLAILLGPAVLDMLTTFSGG